jgi:uncharacterized protein (TIGR03084 family)
MPVDLGTLLGDLAAETASVRALTDPLPDADWALETPSPGWTIADTIGHLAYFDDAAVASATAPDVFRAERDAAPDVDPDTLVERYRHLGPAAIRSWFGTSRAVLLEVFAELDPAARVPWFGPDMSVASAVTARLMETWAHGEDVADTLGVTRAPTDRLRHIAHLGVAVRGFSFAVHGRPAPSAPVRVELDGGRFAWGPPGAADRITGSLLDFCLLVTQRRHRDDTDLVIAGPAAGEWMDVAQAYAGAPGAGRAPRAKP